MTNTRFIIGLIIIIIGTSLLLGIPIFKVLFPLLLIIFGLLIIFEKEFSLSRNNVSSSAEDSIRRVMIFSGMEQKIQSQNFTGGEIIAIFGGGTLDLTEVKTKEKRIELELVAIFGGIKIILPEKWSAQSEGVGIFGGFDNKTQLANPTVSIYTKGAAIFGGVEIVHNHLQS